MTTGDIESHMRELYDIDISDSTISRITDKILPIVKEWQGKEIPDRNTAELFSKKQIQVRREDLVELPEGRYYIFDIIGLEVQDTNGNVLGTVTDVLQPGANDVYVVSKDGEPDQLFAAIEEVVKDIDVENKLMIVDPPEWI